MRGLWRGPAIGACAALAACASRPMPPPQGEPDMSHTLEAPLRDLSLIREAAPDVLTRAAANPYDLAEIKTCGDLAAEIGRLDAALGPDLKSGGKHQGISAQALAADLVSGAVGLPFRGVLRQISGAQARDEALRAAVLAGMVRRGFLKGRAGPLSCPLATTVAAS